MPEHEQGWWGKSLISGLRYEQMIAEHPEAAGTDDWSRYWMYNPLSVAFARRQVYINRFVSAVNSTVVRFPIGGPHD